LQTNAAKGGNNKQAPEVRKDTARGGTLGKGEILIIFSCLNPASAVSASGNINAGTQCHNDAEKTLKKSLKNFRKIATSRFFI